MFNMKDYLLSKSFGEEQYDNELRFITKNWFSNLLVDEKYVTDNKKSKRYNAIYNGKEYCLYPGDNSNKKFVLVPRKDDLFVGDFDDIIIFRKSDTVISLDVKNKTNNKFTNTSYTFYKSNDFVRCNVDYKELYDKENSIYKMVLNSAKNPYEHLGSLENKDCDYWYTGRLSRRPKTTRLEEKDSYSNGRHSTIELSRFEEFNNNISLINIFDYRINKEYGVKKHFSL